MRGPFVFRWFRPGRGAGAVPRGIRPAGFSLLEMIAVLGVIGVLGGLVLPAGRAALEFARAVRTRSIFAQWTVAMELYRAEYGTFPEIAAGGLLDSERLATALTGRDPLGREVSDDGVNGNLRRRSFLNPGATEWLRLPPPAEQAVAIDAFGNSDIGVLYDRDGDGWIRGEEWTIPALRSGNARDGFGEAVALNSERERAEGGVRARIAFVSVGAGGPREPIRSWR